MEGIYSPLLVLRVSVIFTFCKFRPSWLIRIFHFTTPGVVVFSPHFATISLTVAFGLICILVVIVFPFTSIVIGLSELTVTSFWLK